MKFAIINIAAARFSTIVVVVVGVIILSTFLAMHPSAATAAYAQLAAYSTSKLNLVADSCFTTNIELG
jgi:hypothetical protein